MAQSSGWRHDLEKAIHTLKKLAHDRLVVSEEFLTAWPALHNKRGIPLEDGYFRASRRSRPHPVIQFLESAQHAIGQESQVKVILTLRNQASFLASLYAQSAPVMSNPSQRDFEKKVRRMIADNDPFLDFYSLVEELQNILGESNLLVLFFEDGLETNIPRMLSFIYGENAPSIELDYIPHENTRAGANRTWSSHWKSDYLDDFLKRVISLLPRNVVLKKFFRVLRDWSRAASLDGPSNKSRTRLRKLVVTLPIGLEEEIRTHFAKKNHALFSRLEREPSEWSRLP